MRFPFSRNNGETQDVFGQAIVIVDGRLEIYEIEKEVDGTISAGGHVFPIMSGKEYFSTLGERYLVYNLELGAKIEAQAIQKIRESEVIKGLFETPEPKRFMDYLPLVILGLVALVALFV